MKKDWGSLISLHFVQEDYTVTWSKVTGKENKQELSYRKQIARKLTQYVKGIYTVSQKRAKFGKL